MKALGMIETIGLVGAIEAADVALKTAEVEIVNRHIVKGGIVTVELSGDVGAIKVAVEAGAEAAKKLGVFVSSHVIARPDEMVSKMIEENSITTIENINEEIVILTATSGDTGKAALNGFSNVDGFKVVVYYPEKGVSEIQKKQMVTQEGNNVKVIGIRGNFDNAQSGVKEIFGDNELKNKLKEDGFLLSSANSINIGRLIPQIVYYFYV